MAHATLPKVQPPKLGAITARRRIVDTLAKAAANSAVWLHAAGGTGKTTAAASLIASARKPVMWVHLDAGDGEPQSFFHFLQLAAAAINAKGSVNLPVFSPEFSDNLDSFSRRYARALIALGAANGAALVLDNLQDVADNSAVHGIIATLCEELAGAWLVLLVSRSAPSAEYSRLLGQGRLALVPQETIIFTADELKAVLHLRGIADEQRIAEITDRSHGWVAGALLLSMQSHNAATQALPFDRPAQADSGVLFNYFAQEAMKRLGNEDARLLMRTCFLVSVSPAAAKTLAGHDDAEARLEQFVHRGIFTIRLGGGGARYRYHDLFRAFLRQEAAKHFTVADLRELKLASAAMLESADDAHETVDLLIACEAWEEIIGLMGRHADALLASGRYQFVINTLRALPEATLRAQPWMLLLLGQCLRYADQFIAVDALEQAYRAFDRAGDHLGCLVSTANVIVAIYLRQESFGELQRYVKRLHALSGRSFVFASARSEIECLYAMLLHPAAETTHDDRVRLTGRIAELVEAVEDPNFQLYALTSIVEQAWRMRVFEHVDLATSIVARNALEQRASPTVVLKWYFHLITYESMYGNTAAAISCVERGDALAALSNEERAIYDMLLLKMEVACDAGDADRAEKMCSGLKKYWSPKNLNSKFAHHIFTGRIALLRGDGALAVMAASEGAAIIALMGGVANRHPASFMIEAGGEALRGDFEAALAVCERFRPNFTGDSEIVCDIFAACIEALRALRDPYINPVAALTKAMSMAREHRFPLFLRHANSLTQELCATALRAEIETEFVCDVIRRRRLSPPSTAITNWPWPVRLYTLGRFEIVARDGETVAARGQQRGMQLLQALVALGGESAPVDVLVSKIWPGDGRQGTQQVFDTTLHRLRKQLGSDTSILLADRALTLNRAEVWVDAFSLDARLDLLERDADGENHAKVLGEIVAEYRGHFLAHVAGNPWTDSFRNRLWRKLKRALMHEVAQLTPIAGYGATDASAVGNTDRAADILHFIAERDPLAEDAYEALMRHYARAGRVVDALQIYARYVRTLEVQLGLEPSANLRTLADKLRADRSVPASD